MSQALEAEILAAEQRRSSAMLQNSAEALEPVLDPRLIFTHSSGAVDGKDVFLGKVASGRIRYTGITWSDQSVLPLSETVAILAGRMVMDVRVEGMDKQLNNRVTTVWNKTGDDWKLISFQSTPLLV